MDTNEAAAGGVKVKVLIDPGHAPGNANRGPTGYYEYSGMWKLSNYLKTALERCGVVATLSRSEMQNPSLSARGKAAKGYDVFISEHSNAAGKTVRGCTAYYSVNRPGDKKYAAALTAATSKLMGNNDRGPHTRRSVLSASVDYLGVMRAAIAVGVPHVFLMESGFHSNVLDEAWLKSAANLQKAAEEQAKVICDMTGVKYVAPVVKPPEVKPPKAHYVRKGESLAKIAKLYGMSWQAFAKLNGLKVPYILRVGQVLKVEE
jgi:N-acetylmuramoyl-L-alanine amidase